MYLLPPSYNHGEISSVTKQMVRRDWGENTGASAFSSLSSSPNTFTENSPNYFIWSLLLNSTFIIT